MSFGWSAGDIIAALTLLHKVGTALRDSGGASSEYQDTSSFLETLSQTLQHLNALQDTVLDPGIAKNLHDQCDQIQVPLAVFLNDARRRFGPALGANSKRSKLFTAPRKIQWALSTSKKIKQLQGRIAVPMAAITIILGRQIVQTALRMPDDIQGQISQLISTAIDTKITPASASIMKAIEALSIAQARSASTITQRVEEIKGIPRQATHTEVLETQDTCIYPKQGLENVVTVEETSADAMTQNTRQISQGVTKVFYKQAFESCAQSSSLDRKLDQVDSSIGVVRLFIQELLDTQLNANLDRSNLKIKQTVQNILACVWLLLSSLQLRIRELIMLLAPYLLTFYRNTIHGLLQCGDHFLFEDAIGRIKRLPCAQFQYWDVFYRFLVNSFQDTPGLSMVLTGRFLVMNGYNEHPIARDAWRAVIQPRSKVTMSMILDGRSVIPGRCPDVCCSGVISVKTQIESKQFCTVCGKRVSILKASMRSNDNNDQPVGLVATGHVLGAQETDIKMKMPSKPIECISSKTAPRKQDLKEGDHTQQFSKRLPAYQFNQSAAFKRVVVQETSYNNEIPGSLPQYQGAASKRESVEEEVNKRAVEKAYEGRFRNYDSMNRYWLPNIEINKRVITSELQFYLGPDSHVRPYTRDGEDGFLITTPGKCLTDEQIDDICRKSIKAWEKQAAARTKKSNNSESDKPLKRPLHQPIVVSQAFEARQRSGDRSKRRPLDEYRDRRYWDRAARLGAVRRGSPGAFHRTARCYRSRR